MRDLKIDENNNLIIQNKDLVITEGLDCCSQTIKTRVGMCKGENWLNVSEGIDYYNEALGKFGGVDYIESEIRDRINSHPEVVNVNSVSIDHSGQDLNITTEITTLYGVIKL